MRIFDSVPNTHVKGQPYLKLTRFSKWGFIYTTHSRKQDGKKSSYSDWWLVFLVSFLKLITYLC